MKEHNLAFLGNLTGLGGSGRRGLVMPLVLVSSRNTPGDVPGAGGATGLSGWALGSLTAPAGEKGQPTETFSSSSKEFSVWLERSKEI